MGAAHRVVVSPSGRARQGAAAAFLAEIPRDAELFVVGASASAVDALVRADVAAGGARFGLLRASKDELAGRLAAPALAAMGRAPASTLAMEAVVTRVVHRLRAEARLPFFARVAHLPGFARAAARTLEDLRLAALAPDALGVLGPRGEDLAALATAFDDELVALGLADRAAVFEAAAAAASSPRSPLRDRPVLWLDAPLCNARDRALWSAIAGVASRTLATVPEGDPPSVRSLREIALARGGEALRAGTVIDRADTELDGAARVPVAGAATTGGAGGLPSLERMASFLFAERAPPPLPLDGTVTLRAWPGEARECVEIARAIQAEAAAGTPFQRMAVLLRSPAEYAVPLAEALGRAKIPAHFARGTRRPHPAGRALLALLACAAEGLSARRFAEYLTFSQVPEPGVTPSGDAPLPAERELLGRARARLDAVADEAALIAPAPALSASPSAGHLRAPWRWEQLLVDAAVVGGAARWRRRLDGLALELEAKARELGPEEEAKASAVWRARRDLDDLRAYALPLCERLAALPARATWGAWLPELFALADASLLEPEPVRATLAELAPLGPVGPVALDEVIAVLSARLGELHVHETRAPGAVFVAPIEAARGRVFDVVFVPGLAERLFPRKRLEDPLLLDEARARVSSELSTAEDRGAAERLLLRLCVGAAEGRLHLSYPRLDVAESRPRVPSFYAVESLRAAEGDVRSLAALVRGARGEGGARLGWPAPERPEDAIDEAELDLALLGPRVDAAPETIAGAARYLLDASPHLARSLRARARRWLRRWTPADGLVEPDADARAALDRHAFSARSYSATALQQWAACPYRFFLQAVMRLSPYEEPVALERLDPLTRGSLFHDVQFETLSRLRDGHLLPVREANLERALEIVDGALDRVAERYRDALAPAIARVWDDAKGGLRADLRGWLRVEARREDGFVPERFELSFGLADRDRDCADPASVAEAVPIAGGLRLRGAIDLVEGHEGGFLRVTDHKTGRVRAKERFVLGGGEHLQPVLYALACEALLGKPVAEGRLYYCTADGGYADRVVRFDDEARRAASEVIGLVEGALTAGFLPVAPKDGACRFCDFVTVCGRGEAARVARKPRERLADLVRLRGLP